MSFLDKLRSGLQKTRDATVGRIISLLNHSRLDEKVLEDLEEALIEADVGVGATDIIIDRLRELSSQKGRSSETSHVLNLKTELFSLINKGNGGPRDRFASRPWVILLVGVNGSGKTTTAGKLAHHFAALGKSTAIAAADTFRAAAVEQLEVWAKRSNARLIKQDMGGDPSAVAYDAYQSVSARGEDILIVDTAGRLQDKRNLMQELSKINRVMQRFDSSAPHEVMVVIDATTGQNGISQVRGFAEVTGLTGIVVTKLDGSARGGVIIPVAREMELPIEFIGVGEGIDDLLSFDARSYIDALLDK